MSTASDSPSHLSNPDMVNNLAPILNFHEEIAPFGLAGNIFQPNPAFFGEPFGLSI
jgi:hypothetical protein